MKNFKISNKVIFYILQYGALAVFLIGFICGIINGAILGGSIGCSQVFTTWMNSFFWGGIMLGLSTFIKFVEIKKEAKTEKETKVEKNENENENPEA